MGYNIRKKAKNKSARRQGTSFTLAAVWVFSFAFFLWLAWVLWVGRQNGPWGAAVSGRLFETFGSAAYPVPILLLYWLWRSVKHRTLAVLTLIFGVLMTLGGLAAQFSFLKSVFPAASLAGGSVGQALFEGAASITGAAGACLFALACIFMGLHVLFDVPWLATIRKTNEIVRNDFNTWMAARAEFKQKIDAAKAAGSHDIKQSNAPRRVVAEGDASVKPMPKISRPVAEMVKMPPRSTASAPAKPAASENGEKPKKEFELPPLDLLHLPAQEDIIGPSDAEIAAATQRLEATLKDFDIAASVTGVAPGPVVTRYEIKPEPGVKISSIVSISNDIALAMKARGIRVEAPIPGKDAIGFEIPNERPLTVSMREILQDAAFAQSKFKTAIALGRYADGHPAAAVISKMPHLLVAGATNSGKSICIHSLIVSLLYRCKPDELKLLLIDPKRVELTLYEGIPHLYDPKVSCEDVGVVKDAAGAVKSLQALVKVMEKRMSIFEVAKVKNIESYNLWAPKNNEEKMFYIVVIIDELADLMLQTKAAIEDSVQRLTQMGRALGIHLVLSTQRPSTNVITGVIKANLPSRICFQVTSKIDSRVVLDANGADALLGKGDMLYLGISDPKPNRVQGTYVSEEEITKIADFLRAQGGPDYPFQIPAPAAGAEGEDSRPGEGLGTTREEMLSALTLVKERRRISQDLLKAHFGSSARATNILSVFEMKGFISKPEGSNRWDIHFDLIDEQLAQLQGAASAAAGVEKQYDTVFK
ncbi:MAG: DNA translocase FtsK [Elusimicrobiota bacterium]|jgi:S-DNA-T family DNA segregation ATPase FtsK/SpoIIIE|nr:DNA translocase FtsK [Elusimicrobiota bacterium]